jgi:hypothetical protein
LELFFEWDFGIKEGKNQGKRMGQEYFPGAIQIVASRRRRGVRATPDGVR